MGSGLALGGFNPERSIRMTTTPETFPLWTSPNRVVVPMNVPVQYKFAVFSGGSFDRWEPGSTRRRRIIPENVTHLIKDRFQEEEEGDASGSGKTADGWTNTPILTRRKVQDVTQTLRNRGQGLFLVCTYLPVKIIRHPGPSDDGRFKWVITWKTSNIVAKNPKGSVSEDLRTKWIGMVHSRYIRTNEGKEIEAKSLTQADKDDITAALQKLDCEPLWVDDDVQRGFFDGYCKQVLWPILHNVLSLYGPVWNREFLLDAEKISSLYDSYRKVNVAFSKKIVSLMKSPSDVLWIHDYHLMLLPRLARLRIRERWTTTTQPPAIIFFFHSAFPTSEIFRVLARRHELVNGVLGADLVGFHSYNHARHLINTCKRLIGVKHQSRRGGMLAMDYQGRSIGAIIIHVGIDAGYIAHRQSTEEAKQNEAILRKRHAGKTIVVGLDQCQRLQGIALKLLAFEKFLGESSQSLRDKIVLVQRSRIPSHQRKKDTEKTRKEVHELIERIRKKFGRSVIDYEEKSIFSLNERLGFFSAADVMMSTPIGSEHLNMNPLEFVFCHRRQDDDKDAPRRPPGIVVLSEFSMVSEVMNGAICVNPFNLGDLKEALDKACKMSRQERALRIARDVDHVTLSSCNWSRRVLEALDEMWNPATGTRAIAGLDDIVDMDAVVAEPASLIRTSSETGGSGGAKGQIASHAIGSEAKFTQLNRMQLKLAYRKSHKRLLIFNYNGTLVPSQQNEEAGAWKGMLELNLMSRGVKGIPVTDDVRMSLTKLCADSANVVVVISGLAARDLGRVLGDVKDISLVARNGLCVSFGRRFFGELKKADKVNWTRKEDVAGREWYRLHEKMKLSDGNWQKRARRVMRKYCARVPGSTIRDEEGWQVRWDYRGCDPGWSATQVPFVRKELEAELADLLTNFGQLQILPLMGQISVLPSWIGKSAAVGQIVDLFDKTLDFVLCIGDDATDDEMFATLYRTIDEKGATGSDGDDVGLYLFTCMVGVKATTARLCIEDTFEVAKVLKHLAGGGGSE
eukprot:g526.t1